MDCKYCENGKKTETGVEIFQRFENPVVDRSGVVYREKPVIYKTNGMYFLGTEYYDFKITACPICARMFE